MGEVYRACDTRLGRDVALKILPREFVADVERLARFEREARTLASLNHPHIAAIHGVEEAGDDHALVLELVDGTTLAERLLRGPVPIAEAVAIARQIADALDSAHEKGIIHRDLKPANIKVTPDGVVKVLDFGLAKVMVDDARSESLSRSPTVEQTRDGIVLGTAAYMSPEQARGLSVDKRTDIWAFGCVLYEMLAGRLAFPGDTISDRIAAILEREPTWDRLPTGTPAAVHRLLRRCLEKALKRRLRDIGDARIELVEAATGSTQDDVAQRQPAVMTRRTAIGVLFGATAGGAATGLFAVSHYRGATPRRLTQFVVLLDRGTLFNASFNKRVTLAPDGAIVAFNVTNPPGQVLVRPMGDLQPKRLEGVVGVPFFAPQGPWLGYMATDGSSSLKKISVDGGAPITIVSGLTPGIAGATWAEDDTIYMVADTPGGLVRISASGGQAVEVAKVDFAKGERLYKYPHALPGGNAVLVTVGTADAESFDDAHIAAVSIANGERKALVEGGTCPCYSPSGHLVYARGGNLFAVAFDPDRLAVTGQPFKVLEGVLMSRNTGVANFDVSASGDLVYIPGKADGGARTLYLVARDGTAEKLPLPPRSYLHPRISPNGRQLAIEVEGSSHDIHVYDFKSGVLSNLTTDGVSHWPIWSPDGKWIGYRSGPMGRFQLWQIPADRSAAPRRVAAEGPSLSAESYSPDGGAIAYTIAASGSPNRIAVVPLGGGNPQPLDDTRYAQGSPKFSPDGRWIAYCAAESGKPQVYVKAFPGPGPKVQVSNDGGTDPVWKRTGGELYYRHDDSMMAVPVSTTPTFSAGRPEELWKGHYSPGMSTSCGGPGLTSSNYDVTPDGRHFLMIKDDDQDSVTSDRLVVVQAWADEVRRLSAKV